MSGRPRDNRAERNESGEHGDAACRRLGNGHRDPNGALIFALFTGVIS